MSHLKERSEKNCLNCHSEIHGRYCHICGQENIEPVETAWHLIRHFLYDLTHFDGKFFDTLKTLVTKPGFLSAEYVSGRRASYLNPVRMYIFTSAVFFLFAFTAFTVEPGGNIIEYTVDGKRVDELRAMDSSQFAEFSKKNLKGIPQTRAAFNAYLDSIESGMHFFERSYRSREEYDSLLKSGEVKDGWLKRKWIYKEIEANRKYGKNSNQVWQDFADHLYHSFPQLLFISLPLFALILKLLYFRQKRFYYAAHLIFSVNLYIFAFIVMLLIMGIVKLEEVTGYNWLNIFKLLLVACIFFYEYKSLRKFYGQGRLKTFAKFCLLNVAHLIVIIFLVAFGAVFSLLNL